MYINAIKCKNMHKNDLRNRNLPRKAFTEMQKKEQKWIRAGMYYNARKYRIITSQKLTENGCTRMTSQKHLR